VFSGVNLKKIELKYTKNQSLTRAGRQERLSLSRSAGVVSATEIAIEIGEEGTSWFNSGCGAGKIAATPQAAGALQTVHSSRLADSAMVFQRSRSINMVDTNPSKTR
jgi:hypothetical protein